MQRSVMHLTASAPADSKPTRPIPVLADAPTLFFDTAPVFSHAEGSLSFTLATRRFLPDGNGGVIEQDVVSGFLRCTVAGATALRQAIDAALLMAKATPGSQN